MKVRYHSAHRSTVRNKTNQSMIFKIKQPEHADTRKKCELVESKGKSEYITTVSRQSGDHQLIKGKRREYFIYITTIYAIVTYFLYYFTGGFSSSFQFILDSNQ